MTVAKQQWVIGERPLRKILIGEGAENYLHVALNKLQQMYRTNTSPILSQTFIVNGVVIKVDKMATLDRITITAGGFSWVAVTIGRFSVGATAAGAWKQPTNLTHGTLSNAQMPLTSKPVVSIANAAQDFTAIVNAGFNIQNTKGVTDPKLLAQLFPATTATIGYPPYLTPVTMFGITSLLDYRVIWAKSTIPDSFGEITPQFAAFSNRVGGGSVNYRFTRHDLKFGGVHTGLIDPITGFEIRSNMVDVNLTHGPNPFSGRGYPAWEPLTPETYIGSWFCNLATSSSDPLTNATAVSIDGGRTWTYFARGDGLATPLEFTNVQAISHTSYAALSSRYALRLALEVTATETDGFGNIIATDWQHVVDQCGIDGSETRKFVVPTFSGGALGTGYSHAGAAVFPEPAYGPTFAPSAMSLYPACIHALGENTYLLRLPYVFPNAPGGAVFRRITFRSFDNGTTWDAPVMEPFADNLTYWNILNANPAGVGIPALFSNYFIYPRTPRTDNSNGSVYQVVNEVTYKDAGFGAQNTTTGAYMYVSKDLCRTWQQLAQVSSEVFSGYDNAVDVGAPLDPIFPWRLDARVTPPAWW